MINSTQGPSDLEQTNTHLRDSYITKEKRDPFTHALSQPPISRSQSTKSPFQIKHHNEKKDAKLNEKALVKGVQKLDAVYQDDVAQLLKILNGEKVCEY